MGKLFIFEYQDYADKSQNEITDKLQELLSKYRWCSNGKSLGECLGFKASHIFCEGKTEISLCTSEDLKNAVIIEIIRDVTVKGVYDGPLAEESCLIFDSDSVCSIQKRITAWGSRISYGQGKVVFAQSLKYFLNEAGVNTKQYIFCRDAYLDEANDYKELMKLVHG